MSSPAPKLELEDDEQFHRNEWKVQRLAWSAWGLVIVAALLGLLGPGWLSSRQITAPDQSLTIRYDRFARYRAPAVWELLVAPAAQNRGDVPLEISQSLLDCVLIHRIQPEPIHERPANGGMRLTFHGLPSTSTNIQIHFEFAQFGACRGSIGIAGKQPVTVSQFVYP